MAQKPTLRRIAMEDFAGVDEAVRPALEKLLFSLNPFLSTVTDALSGGLTAENSAVYATTADFVMQAETPSAFARPFPLIIPVTLPGEATEVRVLRCADITSKSQTPALTPRVAWAPSRTTDGRAAIQITNVSGLTPGNKFRLWLLVSA